MDYKEKYEEALERAKKWYFAPNSNKIPTFANRVIKEIFPELKESEDERIRKQIKAFIKSRGSQITQSKTDAWLAWLEKQGEQKPTEWSNEDEEKLIMCCKFLRDASVCIDYDVPHKEDIEKCFQWLKSLRPQNHWKPSEEHVDLEKIVKSYFDIKHFDVRITTNGDGLLKFARHISRLVRDASFKLYNESSFGNNSGDIDSEIEATIKMNDLWGDLLPSTLIQYTAYHFYKLGLKAGKEEKK